MKSFRSNFRLFAEHDLFQIDHVYGNRLIVKAVATGFLALPFSAARIIFVFIVILTDIVLQWKHDVRC